MKNYIMIPMAFALSMCTPVHAMDNQDCKYTKTVNQSEGTIVSSTVDYDCKTTPTVIVKESEPTVIYRTGTTVSSPVTTTRVVSSTPVYHNNQSNRTIEDLVNIAIREVIWPGRIQTSRPFEVGNMTVSFKRRDKGQCYYNYDKQGLDCY
tara:strand:- start:1117 stop:1566 length:450 start_codon:yes stop_codon:yes gene_type:complete